MQRIWVVIFNCLLMGLPTLAWADAVKKAGEAGEERWTWRI